MSTAILTKQGPAPLSHTPVSLAKYQLLVDRCARDRLDHDIANGSALHARILIDKLFDIAADNVGLVSGSVRQASDDGVEIYAHRKVIESAKRFLLSPTAKFDVIVQTGRVDGDGANRFFRAIVDDPCRQGTVTLHLPNPGVLSEGSTPHFMLTDQSAYRFETGKDASPTNERITAVANFGDLHTARILGEMFRNFLSLLQADGNKRETLVFPPGAAFAT